MRTKDQIKEFVRVNQYFMNAKEMAVEVGVSFVTLYNLCEDIMIKQADWCKEYMQAHPGKTAEQYAAKLGISIASVISYAKDLGMTLGSPKQKHIQDEFWINGKHYDEITEDEWDEITRPGRILLGWERPKREGFKDKYNQSSSPYGLADELRNIKRKS